MKEIGKRFRKYLSIFCCLILATEIIFTQKVEVVKAADVVRTSLDQVVNIGDKIACRYTAPISGSLGTFSELGTSVATTITPISSSATPDGLFYWIYVGNDASGRKQFIADRNIQHSISWDKLSSSGIASSSGLTLNMDKCIMNINDKSSSVTVNNNNLTVSLGSTGWNNIRATIPKSSGKWYWEVKAETVGSNEFIVGIGNKNAPLTGYDYTTTYGYAPNGQKFGGGPNFTSYGSIFTNGDLIGVMLDLDNHTISFSKNGVNQGIAFSNISDGLWFPYIMMYGTRQGTVNFGDSDFAFSIPNGYAKFNTNNFANQNIGIRLLSGGASSIDKDNEWDNFIGGSNLNNTITAGDNSIWNWNSIGSWTATTPTGVSANRVIRGNTSSTNYTSVVSSTSNATIGLRPTMTVESTAKSVTGISLNKSTLTLPIGESETLISTITPSDVVNKNVIWSSSETSVATVDSNGLVHALVNGTATITATTQDGSNLSASCTVTVDTPNNTNSRAVLEITMSNGQVKEYDLSMTEVSKFIEWYDSNSTPSYKFNKKYNVKPFSSRTEYIAHDKISSFEINEYREE